MKKLFKCESIDMKGEYFYLTNSYLILL